MKYITTIFSSILLFFILIITVLLALKGGLGGVNTRASENNALIKPMLFVGDSVGAGFKSKLVSALGKTYSIGRYDAVVCRAVGFATKCFGKSASSGMTVVKKAPKYSYAVIELGYNDDPATFGIMVDNVMNVLVPKGYEKVIWINVSERKLGGRNYSVTNQKLLEAKGRWPQLIVLDWKSASDGTTKDDWFSDGMHLTSKGNIEFVNWFKSEMDSLRNGGQLPTYVAAPTKAPKNYGQGTGKCRAKFGSKATCMSVSLCKGAVKTGYCPGPSTWKCCVGF